MLLTRRLSITIVIVMFSTLALIHHSRIGDWSSLDVRYHHDDAQDKETPVPIPPLPLPSSIPRRPHADPACDGFPDTSKVLLVMKTGASESFAQVPTHLLTTLRCLSDFLIFSDMDQNIGGQQIYDSLSTVLTEVQEGNVDFDLYRRQKWCPVNQAQCNELGDPRNEGWNLDKYKNVHIAEKAYAMRPNHDWYLFVDADTYVLWPNMMQWVNKLDPTQKLYLGSAAGLNNLNFAHGGSGYLVSKAAMDAFVGWAPEVGNEYDRYAKSVCCGDYIFALALKEKTGVEVQHMFPTINGEKPTTLPFGPSHWCHPIVTMHHLNAEEINMFWHFERRNQLVRTKSGKSRPLILKDIFEEFVVLHLNEIRRDWDNMARDRVYLDRKAQMWDDGQLARMKKAEDYNKYEKKAHLSFEDCAAACKSLPYGECFQYKYQNGVCTMGRAITLGNPIRREEEEDQRIISGWDVEKIRAWVRKHSRCDKINWPNVRTKKPVVPANRNGG
ncbi:glycoprotein-N-acetylgalactosamine 3-beta-galactosyltransferase 1 [Achaetomium macrosporum]|uniref:N-acetylgalactosaminide beta-1,3-galactosyltransferase n=1 Tax=Achaetomium macrosporum TaxID=79813 RepID=A0AAN7H6K2_9PEZI|nr:glycoprotein-N-acetylgalactosamine 3-beta-galactosyltransferase 1 [Achaetomium macrosporum]